MYCFQQATVTGSGEAICKEAKLYGDTYDRNTLNKRDTVDIQAAKVMETLNTMGQFRSLSLDWVAML